MEKSTPVTGSDGCIGGYTTDTGSLHPFILTEVNIYRVVWYRRSGRETSKVLSSIIAPYVARELRTLSAAGRFESRKVSSAIETIMKTPSLSAPPLGTWIIPARYLNEDTTA